MRDLSLLIVPGFMLMTAWTVSVPVLVVEHKGILDSFSRSAELTRGHRWSIFGIIVVFYVCLFIVEFAARPFFGVAMVSRLSGMPVAYLLFNTLIGVITSVIAATGVACIYYELRTAKEGIGPEQLASVFE